MTKRIGPGLAVVKELAAEVFGAAARVDRKGLHDRIRVRALC